MLIIIFFSLHHSYSYKADCNIYTNFDLFGDEAQYWVWSKDLNLGYYSNPHSYLGLLH